MRLGLAREAKVLGGKCPFKCRRFWVPEYPRDQEAVATRGRSRRKPASCASARLTKPVLRDCRC